MPSIFTRSRTASTPKSHSNNNKNGALPPLPPKDVPDEFGRVTSRGSAFHSPHKKDKKKDTKAASRPRTQSSPPEPIESSPFPDGSFMPFSFAPADSPEEPRQTLQSYGYLSYQNEVILGLEEVTRLVDVVSYELSQRGLTTPLLFSNLAIDISPSRIRRLIDAFLRTCGDYHPGSTADTKWREEAQFSSPHELAMTLRWGLARIVRISQGQETRGIISWEAYLRWREDEGAALYPPDYFETFLTSAPPEVQVLLSTLLSFLSRLTAHSNSSGLTPPTLSSLFGPLLFGLGSATLPFHHTYGAYLRCSHATEHLLLAFIRAQDAAASRAVGLPSRLKDWIRGYPTMIPPMDKLDKARHGARTVRLTTVRRNVRLYTFDLVKTGASWASKGERGDLAGCKEWMRVMGPPNAALVPRYSDQYRKRFDIPPPTVPDMGVMANHSQTSSSPSSGSSATSDEFGSLSKEDEKRFRSLTELKWGEFENAGFGNGNDKRLEFDLNEGARLARNEKRSTLSWNDFSTTGFSRTDAPLSATLQFAAPLATTISAWPTRQSELQHKLKKTQKALPPFGWDTSPVLGGEEAVEEGFLDVFCDLLYGSGWVDRREQTFRDCNWALIEYKSMPQSRPNVPGRSDPRTAVSLWLYEEFVPLEYRSQLNAPKRKIPFSFTTSSKSKQWKPAATLNGRPYVMGNVPRTPTTRELEFEGLLSGGNVTKVISLGGTKTEALTTPGSPTVAGARTGSISASLFTTSDPPATPSTARRSRFLPGGGSARKRSPAEYDALDFETRTMHPNLSDDDLLDKDQRQSKSSMGHARGESKDDAWVDILVGAQRRMNDQSAEVPTPGGRRPVTKRRSLSDPELVREEIAQALKDAGPEPPEDDDILLSQDNTHEDGHVTTDEDLYGAPEDHPGDQSQNMRSSMDSGDFEPLPHMRASSQDEPGSPPLGVMGHSRSESAILPPNLQLNTPSLQPISVQPPAPQKLPGKGVSSLIEMYREREKESATPTPSKLPVRTSSLSAKKSSPEPPATEPEPEPVTGETPAGHANPGAPRYVHGAPLHNVVEAPEEEYEV